MTKQSLEEYAKERAEKDPEGLVEEMALCEEKRFAYELALRAYTGELCRLCGYKITMDDIKDGAVFAGYNAENTSRSAHRRCWQGFTEICEQLGLDWHAAQEAYLKRDCEEARDA